MTTIPIHSVKHVKSTYKRYQVMAVASVCITVVAVLITALTGLRLNYLSKSQLATSSAMTTQLSSQHEKESAALKSQLIEMEKQLTAEKELVKNLTAKSTELQNKLNEAKAALQKATAPIPAEPPSAGEQTQPVEQPGAASPQGQPPQSQQSTDSAPSPKPKPEEETTKPAASPASSTTEQPASQQPAQQSPSSPGASSDSKPVQAPSATTQPAPAASPAPQPQSEQ